MSLSEACVDLAYYRLTRLFYEMTTEEEQLFLEQLDKKLWTAADKLRSTLDAAQYKHAVLGLVFLKYVSDSFDHRRQEIEAMLRDEDHDYGVIHSQQLRIRLRI